MTRTWERISGWDPLMTARKHLDQVVRRICRGPRSSLGLFISSTILIWLFYNLMHGRDGVNNRGILALLPLPGSATATTPLAEILDAIIVDAAFQFRPDGDGVRDLDLAYMARQTAVIYELFRIYHGAVSDATFDKEANAIEHAIETLQRILYPWITKTKAEYQYYSSFLNLTASYTEQVGIVISTGKNGGFRWAVHQIVVLRAILKCSLPIEIFYGGDEDLPEKYRSFIKSLASSFQNLGSITTVDITQRFPDPDGVLGLPGGWAMRPFAALASSFQTVILTDADTMFLLDPRIILNENTFKEFGSIFWHDRLLAPASDETYNWVDGLLESAKAKYLDRVRDSNWFRHQTFYEMESGAVVIDKTRGLAGLLMACHMNTRKVRDEITYRRFYGDKESYWLSHALTSTPYHFVPGYSGGIGRITSRDPGDKEHICTLQLLHVLESTQEPFWFNNAIIEFKGANDRQYIHPDAWVPHDGLWHGGGTRFPNELCVEMPEGNRDFPAKVIRLDERFKLQLESMVVEVAKYDALMEKAGLIEISP